MFELIGCPMHFGVSDAGLCNAIKVLNQRFPHLAIREITEVEETEDALPNLKNLNSVVSTCEKIAEAENRVIRMGKIPLFIGGDHAAAMGTVSGASAAYESLGLLWIDAHSDINTDTSTITGNIHGMPVSALLGFGNEKLTDIFKDKPKLLPQNVVFFGLRDVDPAEKEMIEELSILSYYYEEIKKRGVTACLQEAINHLSAIEKLHVSFDLDSMDPEIIRGVTVPVKDGFCEEDIFHIITHLQGHCNLSSIDIVEYNPAYDTDGYTGEFVDRLIDKILRG